MEPRISTLLDQSSNKRLTLDPSVLTTPTPGAHRYTEPAGSVRGIRSNLDSHSLHEHVDASSITPSHARSSAPLARVLNDPSTATHSPQPGRQRPRHPAFLAESPVTGPSSTSPDAPRREDHASSSGYTGGDLSLIQLPKPPQVSRKTAKRPRIPPLLQGLHQPPPLPPKSRLFPPITSDRCGLGSEVGDRFGLGNAFPSSSTDELAKARASPQKEPEVGSEEAQVEPIPGEEDAPVEQHLVDSSTAGPLPVTQPTGRVQNKVKTPRKRTRWSQKETDDLLAGVSRFGIGRWKQILECGDFHFQGRTAVDLKDRFRVCRPGEGLKARKATTPEASVTTNSTGSTQADNDVRLAPAAAVVSRGAPAVHQTISESAEAVEAKSKAIIHGPFMKSRRRARREFNDEDDKNLLKGFKRHGATWHKMRDDFELGFGMRHPTDLRDRFRIRYPDLFAQAGYKLKPKEQRALEEKTEEAKAQQVKVSKQAAAKMGNEGKAVESTTVTTTATAAAASVTDAAATKSKPSSTRPTFELITDFTFSDSDSDADRSPIVLNRNILQWADENSTSIPSTTAAPPPISQAPTHSSTDLLYNPFTASDGLHINPLATLKLPSSAHWSYMTPPPAAAAAATAAAVVAVAAATAAPSLPPPGPLKHGLSATNTTLGSANTTSSSTNSVLGPAVSASTTRAQQEMRTPNLPNIVFPYVPSASARNAVHNLPAPADILSSGQGGAEGWVWIA